ncbi:MAG: hypothetical protein AAFY56_08130 [Pseudomonadota bacterium]
MLHLLARSARRCCAASACGRAYFWLRQRPFAFLLLLGLSACGGREDLSSNSLKEAPAAVEVDRNLSDAPRSDEPVDQRNMATRFCAEMTRLIEAQERGFAGLLQNQNEHARPSEATLSGFGQCVREGRTTHSARMVCVSERRPDVMLQTVELAFNIADLRLETCLMEPFWFPRDWQQGELREFARHERLRIWQDVTQTPRPLVTLKLESLPDRSLRLRLELATL